MAQITTRHAQISPMICEQSSKQSIAMFLRPKDDVAFGPLIGTKAPRNSENLDFQNTTVFRTPRCSTAHTNDKKITIVEAHLAMTLGEFSSVAGAVAQGDFDPGAVIRD